MGAAVQLDQEYPEEKLRSILEAAAVAEASAMNILFDEGFDERKGWTLDVKNEYVTVHYKDLQGKRHFAAQAKVAISPEKGQMMNWDRVGEMADWNSNVKFSRLVGKIGTDTDLAHYSSNDMFMVTSREFIVARRRLFINGTRIVVARSCSTPIVQPDGRAVLAFLNLGVGRYVVDESEPGCCRYDYVVSMDLKGMMPSYLVNQVMGKMVLLDVNNHRIHAEEYGKQSDN